jgi:hypothetical protein
MREVASASFADALSNGLAFVKDGSMQGDAAWTKWRTFERPSMPRTKTTSVVCDSDK